MNTPQTKFTAGAVWLTSAKAQERQAVRLSPRWNRASSDFNFTLLRHAQNTHFPPPEKYVDIRVFWEGAEVIAADHHNQVSFRR
jgi:hypothetical protein